MRKDRWVYPSVDVLDGVIPGVEREETMRGPVWLIPQDALEKFEEWKPKLGGPEKPKAEKVKDKRKT